MIDKSILDRIKEKREFSQLRDIDIEKSFENFSKRQVSDEEKLKLTREQLRKIFSAFISKKLLSLKDKEIEWILRKHLSTKERLPFYEEIYSKILIENKEKETKKEYAIIDLGSGINGFSYSFFNNLKIKSNYTAIDSVGQLIDLMNFYFKKNKFNAKAIHLSLFEIEEIKKIIQKEKSPKIVFLFKVIDALESLERDYSKKLILEILPLVDKIVLSFATKSLGNRQSFKVNRNWITDFIKENFNLLDDFEIGGERYIVFSKSNV